MAWLEVPPLLEFFLTSTIVIPAPSKMADTAKYQMQSQERGVTPPSLIFRHILRSMRAFPFNDDLQASRLHAP